MIAVEMTKEQHALAAMVHETIARHLQEHGVAPIWMYASEAWLDEMRLASAPSSALLVVCGCLMVANLNLPGVSVMSVAGRGA